MSFWQLDGQLAHLTVGDLRARFDAGELDRGLQDVRLGSTMLAPCLLAAVCQPADRRGPDVVYVRDPDLVCEYHAQRGDELHRTMYFRVGQDSWSRPAGGRPLGNAPIQLEALLSLNTSSLETSASASIGSHWSPDLDEAWYCQSADRSSPWNRFEGGSLETRDANLVVLRGRQPDPGSFALAAHPSDFESLRIAVSTLSEHAADRAIRSGSFDNAVDSATSGLSVAYQLRVSRLEKGVIRRLRVAVTQLPPQDDLAAARQWLDRFERLAPPLTT